MNKIYFMYVTQEQYENSLKLDNVVYFVKKTNGKHLIYIGQNRVQLTSEDFQKQIDELLAGASEDLNTLKELGDAFKSNKKIIEEINKVLKNGEALTELKNDIANLNSSLKNKQSTLESGINIKTINGKSVLGNGNLKINELPSNITNLDNHIKTISQRTINEAIDNGEIGGGGEHAPKNKTIIESLVELKNKVIYPQQNTMIIQNAFPTPMSGLNVTLFKDDTAIAKILLRPEFVSEVTKTYELMINNNRYYVKITKLERDISIVLTDRGNYNGYDIGQSKVFEVVCYG